MNRELTTREKTLLLVLAVLVIALGYWKLVFEPINEQVASYNDMAEQEQAEIDSSVVQLAQMRKMQKAVEAQKEAVFRCTIFLFKGAGSRKYLSALWQWSDVTKRTG